MTATLSLVRSDNGNDEPEEDFAKAIESAGKVLKKIETKLSFRKAEGLERHDSADENCDKEKVGKLSRKERVRERLKELDALVFEQVQKQTNLEMEVKRLNEEMSKTKRSLDDSTAQVASLDKEAQKTDAEHEAMLGALEEAVLALEAADKTANAKADADKALAKSAGALLAERLGATEEGTSPGMDVVLGALKGFHDKVTAQRDEDMKSYYATRNSTVAVIKTCEEELEEQFKEYQEFDSQLAIAKQKLVNSKRERVVLQTKVAANEDVLDSYALLCEESLAPLAQRHRHRIEEVVQFIDFAKAAVKHARYPSNLIQKRLTTSAIQHHQVYGLTSKTLPQSSGLKALHKMKDSSQPPLSLQRKVAHATDHFLRTMDNSRLARPRSSLKPAQHTPEGMMKHSSSLYLRCKRQGAPPQVPALLAASWALQDAATQLKSRALHRTACEVRFKTPQDARHLLGMLADSLQKRVVTVKAASSRNGNDDECSAKKKAHEAEVRTAKETLQSAQNEASTTELLIGEYEVEKEHLESYVPKMKDDVTSLADYVSKFDELYKGDAEAAADARTLLSGVIDEVTAVKAQGPEEPLADLDKALKDLKSESEADLEQVKSRIGGVQQKLMKQRSLLKQWDEWLEKAISGQQDKLKKDESARDKAKKELEDLESSAPECTEESLLLLSHWRQTHHWTSNVEIAAVQLALSLLSDNQQNVTAGQ